MSDLQRLLLRLAGAGIEFVLVGGYAAMLHGSSLLTRDLDVCAALTPETIEQLREVYRDAHPWHRLTVPRLSFLDKPRAGVDVNNLCLSTDLGALDLLGSITGVGDYYR